MSDKLREAASIWWDRPCYKCRSHTCDMSCEAALAEPAIKESLTVAEQEPVAFVDLGSLKFISHTPDTTVGVSKYRTPFKNSPLYTAPPRREWVGLTDDEVNLIYAEPQTHVGQYAKAIEAKLREKNT